MNGLFASIGTNDEKAFFPALNIYHENGKVLVQYEFSEGSLKNLDSTFKGGVLYFYRTYCVVDRYDSQYTVSGFFIFPFNFLN